MKTLVAWVVTAQKDGHRQYTAFTKDEKKVAQVTVIDCGYGAKVARDWAVEKNLRISWADWACAIARKYGV